MPGERSPATPPNDLFTREKPLQGPPRTALLSTESPPNQSHERRRKLDSGATEGRGLVQQESRPWVGVLHPAAHRAPLEGFARSLGRRGGGEAQRSASGSPVTWKLCCAFHCLRFGLQNPIPPGVLFLPTSLFPLAIFFSLKLNKMINHQAHLES